MIRDIKIFESVDRIPQPNNTIANEKEFRMFLIHDLSIE
jgi:hypothetical protein